MSRVFTLLRRGGRERGQAMLLFAAGLAGFCGLVGMSIDVGHVVFARTDLQKIADAAVMAGAQDLPSASSATSSASTYVTKNGAGTATITIGGATNDTITVKVTRRVDYTFLRLIGLSGANPSASATAKASSYTGGSGIMPLGLLASGLQNGKVHNNCYVGPDPVTGLPTFTQNTPCTLHDGASDCAPGTQCTGGDFGELALDGSGGSDYRNALAHGSTKVYSAGDKVNTQTGNQVGPTTQGLQDHLAQTPPPGCGTQATSLTTVDGVTTIKPGCEGDPHIWIVPVVNQFNNPAQSTILGFAFMWVDGIQTKGGHTQLTGKFLTFVTALQGGVYNGTSGGSGSATTIRLTQ